MPDSVPLADLGRLPDVSWAAGLAEAWTPGEAGAADRLEGFAARAEEYADVNHTFFVADQSGYISRQLADRYVGVANFDDRLSARNLVNFFTEIWDRSQQDPQLRRLHL